MADPKPRPNHRLYLQILRRMSPEQRLRKAFELSEFAQALFLQGLGHRFPDATDEQLHRIYLDRLARCHNRNY
ncbi:MAG TPA: hypothetical protein EYP56_17185 [Planctomycetaceae bacterium]|nr:hypothetical protein [Planctomycetaceae bacterium]HIQ23230.1 hypothetical protein [Planctomycetota bacterium]